MSASKWFIFMAVFAFASVISFFQINSYAADKHHLNSLFVVLGIVAGMVAVFGLTKVIKNSNYGDNNQTK